MTSRIFDKDILTPDQVRNNAPAMMETAHSLAGRPRYLWEALHGASAVPGELPAIEQNPQGTVGIDMSGPPYGPCLLLRYPGKVVVQPCGRHPALPSRMRYALAFTLAFTLAFSMTGCATSRLGQATQQTAAGAVLLPSGIGGGIGVVAATVVAVSTKPAGVDFPATTAAGLVVGGVVSVAMIATSVGLLRAGSAGLDEYAADLEGVERRAISTEREVTSAQKKRRQRPPTAPAPSQPVPPPPVRALDGDDEDADVELDDLRRPAPVATPGT